MCDDFIPQVWKKELTRAPAIFTVIHNLWRIGQIYLLLNNIIDFLDSVVLILILTSFIGPIKQITIQHTKRTVEDHVET